MPRSDQHTIRRATAADVEAIADDLGLSLSEQEREDYLEMLNGSLEGFEAVAERPEPRLLPETEYTDRPPGRRPDPEEDPHNAWILQCRVEGADDGPLAGMEVALKDTVALAGYELTAGSDVLAGFTPTVDATVVRRLLDAGATITGKLNMESFAFSGSGDTSDFGDVLNPHDHEHLAGGSSSGSGVVAATGEVDVAIGGDQAGSIRIPAAWCGAVGIKPTTGLVPYTGAFALDMGLDHLGPMAPTVEPVARTLGVLAGEDVVDGLKLDPRQPRGVEADDYTSGLDDGVSDLSIGVLAEGFDWEFSEPEVDDAVRDAVDVLADEGAEVGEASMELHRLSIPLWGTIGVQGGYRLMRDGGVGSNYKGWYWTELAEAMDAFTDARADDLPPSIKNGWLTAEYLRRDRGVALYAKARNLALEAERRYNRLLEEFDVLVLPTVAVRAMERDDSLDRVAATTRELVTIANTSPFDLTSHPAVTVPCAKPDGLPVGLMVVGSHFDEATILRVARAFEAATDWESR